MECETLSKNSKEFLEHFNAKVVQQRIPASGTLMLTYRCNLKCVHCYLGDKTVFQERVKEELSTTQWLKAIDEITEAGCLTLLITGGEPLLRNDFGKIYRHAKMNGLLVTVFTNGTLVTEQIIELFTDLPPYGVEITLYGATPGTYGKITGSKKWYNLCLQGIQRLVEGEVQLRLKTILMTHNLHEFEDIEQIAKEYEVPFRFDAGIVPCLNSDQAPLKLRVSAREAITKEFADKGRAEKWKIFFEKRHHLSSPSDSKLYRCGSGLKAFAIDPYGNLQPCLMVTSLKYNIIEGDFLSGWQKIIPDIRERTVGTNFSCHQCEYHFLCGYCPAFFDPENSAKEMPYRYFCDRTKYRFEMIQQLFQKGGKEYAS